MNWTFKLRGQDVTFAVAEAIAVKPEPEFRERAGTRSAATRRFGKTAKDDGQGEKFGLALPARNRRVFENAGWVFVESRPPLAAAAERQAPVPNAQTVQTVLIDPSGDTLITTGLLTVQLQENIDEAAAREILARERLEVVEQLRFATNLFQVRAPKDQPLLETIHDLQQKADLFVFAEPDLLQALVGRFTPGDDRFSEQWQHAAIQSELAWNVTRGAPVRVAVIDNGFQINHPDLKDGIVGGGFFQSGMPGEAKYIPFHPGMSGFPVDRHGTLCLGMVGARVNGQGVCGSAPEAELIAIAAVNDQVGTQTTLARAIAVAADPTREVLGVGPVIGADVISCSLGPNSADWVLTSALDMAIRFAANFGRETRGVPIFWAVSNGHVALTRDLVASHDLVIAVGRSNRDDCADGSAFGPKLELLAPGVGVLSTAIDDRYDTDTGTSFATPLVAGVAALIISVNPLWTRQEVLERIRACCEKVGSQSGVAYSPNGPNGRNDEYGFGRVNAARAVQ